MKQIDLFNKFLNDTVNLNATRLAELDKSTEAIKTAIRDSEWKPKISAFEAQGSWAHKTIIKPVDNGEFDADLLVFVDPVDGWTPKQYVDELYTALRANETYKNKLRRFSHCVTVEYANEKKIDVAPVVINRGGFTRLEVCNRASDEFQRSEPRKYTNWLIEKNSYSGSNSFRKVTRLIKYLRDIKTRFTCSSVLLTTILGYRISSTDKDSDEFADTPTALKTIFGRMDDWLQENAAKPSVANPFLSSENFADGWDDDQYSNFRDKIHTYREWIDDAYDEQDRNESIAKWRRVFGEDFAKAVDIEEGASVGKSALIVLKRDLPEARTFSGDFVEAIKRFGSRIIPAGFNKRPYMEVTKWRRATNMMTVRVRADLYDKKFGMCIREVQSLEPLPAEYWLHFRAVTNVGTPFDSDDFQVEWRVTNTDEQAWRARELRGKFYTPGRDNTQWESLKYRGVHLVEAFVIRKRGDILVGQSEAFRVMIE